MVHTTEMGNLCFVFQRAYKVDWYYARPCFHML